MGEALLVRSVAGSPAVSDVFTLTTYSDTKSGSYTLSTSESGSYYPRSGTVTLVNVSATATPLVKVIINSLVYNRIYHNGVSQESYSNLTSVSSATTKRMVLGGSSSLPSVTSPQVYVYDRNCYCRAFASVGYNLSGDVFLKIKVDVPVTYAVPTMYYVTLTCNYTVVTCEPKGLF